MKFRWPSLRERARGKILLALALIFLTGTVWIGRPILHIAWAVWSDTSKSATPSPGTVNDASRQQETRVAEIWRIPPVRAEAEAQLVALLQRAKSSGLKVSIAGARHSMGGHAIYPDGVMIDMLPFHAMTLDETKRILHVEAGARWSEVIPFLNSSGWSVEVMQSNNDFSVGGSMSVNCHGWQANRPPIASTVRSFRLMLADGRVVRCGRDENQELFSLALGGYGLFGVILDAELQVVPNRPYRLESVLVPAADFALKLGEATASPEVEMIYGRMRVTQAHFLEEAILNVLSRGAETNRTVSALAAPKYHTLGRAVFRGSVDSDYGKQLRWDAERLWYPRLLGNRFERNDLLNVSSAWFQEHDPGRTDILMELFVPPHQFEPFLAELRRIVPAQRLDLLNVTVRQVLRDEDTFLRFADRSMLALVLLFNHTRTAEGETRMAQAAHEITAAALRHEGRYYLPYRPHATPEQFVQAYPRAREFFALKRKYDPEEIFQNGFYQQYGAELRHAPGLN